MCIRDRAETVNTPETKQLSKQWPAKGESAPKKEKTIPSAGKVMVSSLTIWQGRNGEYYANLLCILNKEIKKKAVKLAKEKASFHQDNTVFWPKFIRINQRFDHTVITGFFLNLVEV